MNPKTKAFETVDGLLESLGAAARVQDPVSEAFEAALSQSEVVPWTRATKLVKSFFHPPPEGEPMEAWLDRLAFVDRVAEALDRMADPPEGAKAMLAAIEEEMSQVEINMNIRKDHPLFAAHSARRIAEEGARRPWIWAEDGHAGSYIREGKEQERKVVREYLEDGLGPTDTDVCDDLSRRSESFMDSIVVVARELLSCVRISPTNPERSINIVRSADDMMCAAPVARLRLPGGGEVRVYQTPSGTRWKYPDGAEEEVNGPKLHTWKFADHEVKTNIEVLPADDASEVAAACASLDAISRGRCVHRAEQVIRTSVELLSSQALESTVEKGHLAFRSGEELGPADQNLLKLTLNLRVSLSSALSAAEDSGLDALPFERAVLDLDESFRPFLSAVLSLDDSVYAEIVEGIPVDEGAWWGHPEKVRQSMSDEQLDEFLRASRPSASVVSLDDFRKKRARTSQTFSRERVRLAAASPEKASTAPCLWWTNADGQAFVGSAPVLLLDVDQKKGVVAELRVTVSDVCSESELWKKAPELRSVARESIRDAYFAAVRCAPHGAAPYAFGQHRLELIIASDAEPENIEVEGRSLGLSAALAFSSLWIGKPIKADVLPSATVGRSGYIGEVIALDQKALGASEYASIELRAITAASQASSLASSLDVSKLEDALKAAELDMSQLQLQGGAHQRLTTAQKVAGDIKNGNLAAFGESATWIDAGDQLSQLVSTLDDKVAGREQLVDLKCWAALAYSHAGSISDIRSALNGVDRSEVPSLASRTLIDIVRLGTLIDTEKLGTADGKALIDWLTEDIADLRSSQDPRILGSALGTLGRAHLHSGQPKMAKPLLQDAVAAHVSHVPHEASRSRVYLAMALRALGENDEALRELEKAENQLSVTWDFSPEYEAQCRMYLDYEKARVLLSLDRTEDALESTASALGATPKGVWWPTLGILRTRAQALRALDRIDEADACVEAMKKLGTPTSGEPGKLVSAIMAQAGRTYSSSDSTY